MRTKRSASGKLVFRRCGSRRLNWREKIFICHNHWNRPVILQEDPIPIPTGRGRNRFLGKMVCDLAMDPSAYPGTCQVGQDVPEASPAMGLSQHRSQCQPSARVRRRKSCGSCACAGVSPPGVVPQPAICSRTRQAARWACGVGFGPPDGQIVIVGGLQLVAEPRATEKGLARHGFCATSGTFSSSLSSICIT
jgi:hypothetical protein